jgi:hypothetical protein
MSKKHTPAGFQLDHPSIAIVYVLDGGVIDDISNALQN